MRFRNRLARWKKGPRRDFGAVCKFNLTKLSAPVQIRHWLEWTEEYDAWKHLNRLTAGARADVKQALEDRKDRLPKISILMPVFRPSLPLLDQAIQSINDQIFSFWELCIADDGSNNIELKSNIQSICLKDSRVKYTSSIINCGISNATNIAFSMSSGDILLFVDQDDIISPDCLAEIAIAFSDNPELDLLYSDSDKIDLQGKLVSPAFKPGWSPTLLMSYMYLGHAVAVRSHLFKQLGGLRPEYDGSQDYDFALRASEQARQVAHIPKVLYHWRMAKGSTALSGGEKPESIDAGRRAIRSALERRNITADAIRPQWAEEKNLGLFDLKFGKIDKNITIVISLNGSYDENYVTNLIDYKYANENVDIVILYDSANIEIEQFKRRILLIYNKIDNFTFIGHSEDKNLSCVYNLGALHAKGDFLIFISPSVYVMKSKWVDQLVGHCRLPGVGAAGARLLQPDGRIQHAGLIYPSHAPRSRAAFHDQHGSKPGYMYLARVTHECAAVSADCLVTPRETFELLGGFRNGLNDTAEIGIAYSEAVRRMGKRVLFCASAELKVTGSSEPGSHRPTLKDPYYNVNLGDAPELYKPAYRCPTLRTQRPIRVAFVSHNLELEGAPITLFDLVTGLAEAGVVTATIWSPRDGPLAEAYREKNIPVHIFDAPSRKVGIEDFLQRCDELGRHFTAIDIEVVFANTLDMFFAVDTAERHGIAALWWHHESGSWKTYFNAIPRKVRAHAYAAFAQAYRVIYVAEATRSAWLPVCTRRNFQVVRYAISPRRQAADLGRWSRSAARKALQIDDDQICVLLLGSICARKGQIDMIRAMKALRRSSRENIQVFIVGSFVEHRYRVQIEKELSGLSPDIRDRISLTGAVDDSSIYYAAADIFICCSRRESAPRVLLEAMAFQLPVICTPVDGIPELVRPNDNAYFYEPGDTSHLALLLSELMASDQERRRLGQNGPERLAEVSNYQRMIAEFSELIREAARTTDAVSAELASSI
jgi:glycosyltransferase involved in cell wall biosynthesis